jgi:hypothetical protein
VSSADRIHQGYAESAVPCRGFGPREAARGPLGGYHARRRRKTHGLVAVCGPALGDVQVPGFINFETFFTVTAVLGPGGAGASERVPPDIFATATPDGQSARQGWRQASVNRVPRCDNEDGAAASAAPEYSSSLAILQCRFFAKEPRWPLASLTAIFWNVALP